MQAILSVALPLTATQKGLTNMGNNTEMYLCEKRQC